MKILTLLLFAIFLYSSPFTDKAYKEYKKHHYKSALHLYKKATDPFEDIHSRIKAHYNLGIFYYKGLGVKRDLKKAKENFESAVFLKDYIYEDNAKYREDKADGFIEVIPSKTLTKKQKATLKIIKASKKYIKLIDKRLK